MRPGTGCRDLEELTKAGLEAGTSGQGRWLPARAESLMARRERVPEVKRWRSGACLDASRLPLLAAILPLPEVELQAALDRLVAAELVFGRGEPPAANYTFKHALVRDAAHESLLRAQRQQLHGRIVRALEERFLETVNTEPELLAQHCTEAGLAERRGLPYKAVIRDPRSATAEASRS